ncbi:MAG: hypothetical protein Q8R92_21135 [Deltaproteobacteria bacterium]|nr:hypothetical protein [Deltaproteobacteria bacterium]
MTFNFAADSPLSAAGQNGAEFVSPALDASGHDEIAVICHADQPGAYQVEWGHSFSGVVYWDGASDEVVLAAEAREALVLPVYGRWVRFRFRNAGEAQTTFRCSGRLHRR